MYDIPLSVNTTRQGMLPKLQDACNGMPCPITQRVVGISIVPVKETCISDAFLFVNERQRSMHTHLSPLYADRVPGVLSGRWTSRAFAGRQRSINCYRGEGTTIKPATIRAGSRMKLNDSSG